MSVAFSGDLPARRSAQGFGFSVWILVIVSHTSQRNGLCGTIKQCLWLVGGATRGAAGINAARFSLLNLYLFRAMVVWCCHGLLLFIFRKHLIMANNIAQFKRSENILNFFITTCEVYPYNSWNVEDRSECFSQKLEHPLGRHQRMKIGPQWGFPDYQLQIFDRNGRVGVPPKSDS